VPGNGFANQFRPCFAKRQDILLHRLFERTYHIPQDIVQPPDFTLRRRRFIKMKPDLVNIPTVALRLAVPGLFHVDIYT
jgi:hypothetical protein